MSTQKSPTGRILVGTDGSPASVAAVRWAGREAQLRGMRVHVVYVQDRRHPAPAYYAPRPRPSEGAAAPGGESTLKAVVREALGTKPAGVQMELADGAPARVLLERSVGAEMLVLGSTRRGSGPAPPAAPTLQSRTPLGPVARDCLHAAPCPVVVVRSSDVQTPAAPAESAHA